jgi:hypothetical protein
LRPNVIIAGLAGILAGDDAKLHHARNPHAHEAKLGCEKGSSNTETEVDRQESSENEKTEGDGQKVGSDQEVESGRRGGVVHDGKVGFDVAALSCRPENGKSPAVSSLYIFIFDLSGTKVFSLAITQFEVKTKSQAAVALWALARRVTRPFVHRVGLDGY